MHFSTITAVGMVEASDGVFEQKKNMSFIVSIPEQ